MRTVVLKALETLRSRKTQQFLEHVNDYYFLMKDSLPLNQSGLLTD
jgi:hypothetical protein